MIPSVISCTRETATSNVNSGVERTGSPSNRYGVARQHEHVASRRAVKQRKIQESADPQRDRKAEQFGCIHEVRNQNDRTCCADQRSQDAIDRLRRGCPGQRVGGDIRPIAIAQ